MRSYNAYHPLRRVEPHGDSSECDPELSLCDASAEPYQDATPGFSGINLCLICRVDMGDCNGRQLCGKVRCANEDFVVPVSTSTPLIKLRCKITIVYRLMKCYQRAMAATKSQSETMSNKRIKTNI